MLPLKLPTAYNGHKKKFTLDHAMPYHKGGLILVWRSYATKEWEELGAWYLIHSAIS